MPPDSALIAIGITTRNRLASLTSCLASLETVAALIGEVFVVDDASDVPVTPESTGCPASLADRLTVVRQSGDGYIVARNLMVRRARHPFVLLLDDDTRLLGAAALIAALAVLEAEDDVAAVGFAQAEPDGRRWPARMQPSAATVPSYVPSFIGFAHLLRRSTFLRLGGYRESFHCYGEEKDYCLRALAAGQHTVYLPDALIVHAPDPAGRSTAKYVRYAIRNDCLFGLYNEPLLMALFSVPVRLSRYVRMRGGGLNHIAGALAIAADLLRLGPRVWRARAPVSWRTMRRWRAMRAHPVPLAESLPATGPCAFNPSGTLTVGITTRNRQDSLDACLRSLDVLGDLVAEIIVVDDASDVPVADMLPALPPSVARKVKVLRQPTQSRNIAGRNAIMRAARTDDVLLMDDDTTLIDPGTIDRGLRLFGRDPRVAAVGFAMAAADGSSWPAAMQPAPVTYPCYVPSFIGFAHLIRRRLFFQIGAYRELFSSHGEEKEWCLRLIDAGYDVVYLPDARIVHRADPAGRNLKRYLRYVIRNDCLNALYNEPLPLLFLTVPLKLGRYLYMRRAAGVVDPGGLRWILVDILRNLRGVWRERRAVRWTTIFRWRRLKRTSPPYAMEGA